MKQKNPEAGKPTEEKQAGLKDDQEASATKATDKSGEFSRRDDYRNESLSKKKSNPYYKEQEKGQ